MYLCVPLVALLIVYDKQRFGIKLANLHLNIHKTKQANT